MWDWALPGRRYVIGADVAESKVRDRSVTRRRAENFKDRPDYSAAVVLEVESGEHVASWHGWESTFVYAQALYVMGMTYNKALIVPELNGPGLAVTETLFRSLSYPNLYISKSFGKARSLVTDENVEFGFRTTGSSRAILIHRIHEVLDDRSFTTRDLRLVKELRSVQYDEMGVPRAKGVDKDDMVMALGLALQGRQELLTRTQDLDQQPSPRGPDAWIWDKIRRMSDRMAESTRRR